MFENIEFEGALDDEFPYDEEAARYAYEAALAASASDGVEADGDNSFPNCACCGHCCCLNVLAMTEREIYRILDYLDTHDVQLIDRKKRRCCFQGHDGKCMIWEARPQVCKLHHCIVSQTDVLKDNPHIVLPNKEDVYLIDVDDCFLHGRIFNYRDHQDVME